MILFFATAAAAAAPTVPAQLEAILKDYGRADARAPGDGLRARRLAGTLPGRAGDSHLGRHPLCGPPSGLDAIVGELVQELEAAELYDPTMATFWFLQRAVSLI